MYDSSKKLRECLVLKFEWAPADAARRIAIYNAQVRRLADSIQQVWNAEARAILRQRQREDARAASHPYWGSRKAKVYYTNTPNCAALQLLQRGDRAVIRE